VRGENQDQCERISSVYGAAFIVADWMGGRLGGALARWRPFTAHSLAPTEPKVGQIIISSQIASCGQIEMSDGAWRFVAVEPENE